MKHILKKSAVLFLAIALTLATFGFVGCAKEDPKTYTIKVIGPDGNPYTAAQVQICKANDANGFCIAAFPDEQGVITFEIGKEITDTSANLMDVHLLNLPPYYTYQEPVTMRRGDSITVYVTERVPKKGTGTGSYSEDKLGNERLEIDPYEVEEAAYKMKFTDAAQHIFLAFAPISEGIYKVYSVGDVDVAVTQLSGNMKGVLWNSHDDAYTHHDISETDKNFSYEFEVEPAIFSQLDPRLYFEVELEDPAHVNTDFYIYFEYVDDFIPKTGPETVPVEPKKTPEPFADYAASAYTYRDAPLTGQFVYTLCSDGFYHAGETIDDPILVASLGKDPELNEKHTGSDVNAPRGYAIGFTLQYKDGGSLTFSDDVTYSKNYYPLVEAYTKASNSDGRYGVTEELKEFLEGYIARTVAKDWVQGSIGFLPKGDEWLWACGYYEALA